MGDLNEDLNNSSHEISDSSADRPQAENISMNVSNQINIEHTISFAAGYRQRDLYQKLIDFKESSNSLTTQNLQESARRIHRRIKRCDENLRLNTDKIFSIELIEHSHYIYAFRQFASNSTQEDINILENRAKQFEDHDYPREEFYTALQSLLEFFSQLLFKWKIFDINDYGYRYKGRSLTVKVIDMMKINQQCLTTEICWFSYAINHLPFAGRIQKMVVCYAEVLQREIDKGIVFLRNNDLRNMDFKLKSKWRCWQKKDNVLTHFYEILKGIEVAYRHFERSLIEEFLKIV